MGAVNDPMGAFLKALKFLLVNDFRKAELKKEVSPKKIVKAPSRFDKPERKESRKERRRRLENKRIEKLYRD